MATVALPFVRIGCAGWNVPKQHGELFPSGGSHLERYAGLFSTVEINSSFYKPHRPATYARWAQDVPDHFDFTVKMPREITHGRRLSNVADVLDRFLSEVAYLGDKLGALLVQLPPSLPYEHDRTAAFLAELRTGFAGNVACEPRHRSWFTQPAAALLAKYRVVRVAADPAVAPIAVEPAGDKANAYYRLHGSPRMYYSTYGPEYLLELANQFRRNTSAATIWCIFDNTAQGAAARDAYDLQNIWHASPALR